MEGIKKIVLSLIVIFLTVCDYFFKWAHTDFFSDIAATYVGGNNTENGFKVLFDMYVYKGWEYHINQSHDMDSFQLCLAFLILLALSLRNFGMLIKKILMLLKEYEMGRL